MTLKTIILVWLCFMMSSYTINAQSSDSTQRIIKNSIYFSPTAIAEDAWYILDASYEFVWANIGYERHLNTSNNSIGLRTGWVVYSTKNITRGFNVFIYHKYFFTKTLYYSTAMGFEYTLSSPDETSKYSIINHKRWTVNSRIGMDIGKNLYFDLSLGLGFNYYINITSQGIIKNIEHFWQLVPRNEFNIGYKF